MAVLGAGCARCRGGEIRGDSVRFFSGPNDDSGGGDGGAQPLPILPARPSIGLLGRSAAPVVALFRERLESNWTSANSDINVDDADETAAADYGLQWNADSSESATMLIMMMAICAWRLPPERNVPQFINFEVFVCFSIYR